LRLLELPYLLDRNSEGKDMSPYPSLIPRGKPYPLYWTYAEKGWRIIPREHIWFLFNSLSLSLSRFVVQFILPIFLDATGFSKLRTSCLMERACFACSKNIEKKPDI